MRNEIDEFENTEELKNFLQAYRVPYPSEDQVNDMIESLGQYVPSRKEFVPARADTFLRLIQDAAISLRFMGVSYWIITLLLYLAGAVVVSVIPANPCKLLLILGPLPVMLGLLEVFHGREEKMLELELVCKITAQEIVLSRIMIICIYNAILNVGLSGIIGSLYPAVLLWRITLLWLAPMILTGGIALWFCSFIRSEYAVLGSVSCWIAAAFVLASQDSWFENLLNLNIWYLIPPLCAGFGLFLKEIVGIRKRTYFKKKVSAWN